MTEREQELETLLRKIVNRANPPTKATSADILLQYVPAALIDQARELLKART